MTTKTKPWVYVLTERCLKTGTLRNTEVYATREAALTAGERLGYTVHPDWTFCTGGTRDQDETFTAITIEWLPIQD